MMGKNTSTTFHGNHLGQAIAYQRRKKGIPQNILAHAVGIEPEMLNAYEREEAPVPAQLLLAIAYVLDVPAAEFYPEPTVSGSFWQQLREWVTTLFEDPDVPTETAKKQLDLFPKENSKKQLQ